MSEFLPEVEELLDFADLAFGSGYAREGCRLMWEASIISLTAVADKYGWPCKTLDEKKKVIHRLDDIATGKNSDNKHRYFLYFGTVESFREHAETYEWDYPQFQWTPYELRGGCKSIKKFIAMLAEFDEIKTNSP